VEANLVVPVWAASRKLQYSAATIRPRITALLDRYLVPLKQSKPRADSLGLRFDGLETDSAESMAARLKVDESVGPSQYFTGGTSRARRLLAAFIKNNLQHYSDCKNDPCADCVSNMSPYLHFGQVSPLYIALEVIKSGKAGANAYLEELIVRRQLAHNMVFYNRKYDAFRSLPAWTRATLLGHRHDRRPYLYSLAELENARTHDPYWNAAQRQMTITGKMHGYMRMYWGKKIIEWTANPRTAFRRALYLNNKYQLDGRDANGFAGVAWCFGLHDRPWKERPVFGMVRYMNAAGLERKFDMDRYVRKIERLGTI
jgi:deoxyribodipyrimidine photo-lyase